MAIFTITSDDTLTLFDRVFNDYADDDVTTITFPNELVQVKTGKNQNTIFSKDEKGNNAQLVLRLMRGSSDDQFMQNLINLAAKDFVSQVLASGQFVKRLGDGQGNVRSDVYTLAAGIVTKLIEGKENVSGDTAQGVAIYNITFAKAERSIQ